MPNDSSANGPAFLAEPGRLSRSTAFVRGVMVGAAPGFAAVLDLGRGLLPSLAEPRTWLAGIGALLLLCGAGAVGRRPRLAIGLLWASVAVVVVLTYGALRGAPAVALLLGLATAAAGRGLRVHPGRLRLDAQQAAAWTARGAAAISTALWVLVTAAGVEHGPAIRGLGLIALAAVILAMRWALRFRSQQRAQRALLLATTIIVAAMLPFLVGRWSSFFGLLAIVPAAALLLLPSGPRPIDETAGWSSLLFSHPPRLLVFTFALLCMGGTVVLALPFSSASPHAIGYVDALFTAVSAVCVTGLIVLDTPVAFGVGGQVVILLLIQLGALGIMTFSTAAIALLGRRMSLSHEGAVAGLIAGTQRGQVHDTVKRILLVTAVCEGAGGFLLTLIFWHGGLPPLAALGKGIFTAVSAFCNAGFALDSDSLISQAGNPLVLHTVSSLIILGGISPFLVLRLDRVFRGRHTRAQEKIVLATTGVLLVSGAALFAAFEWSGSLAGLSLPQKLSNAWFQSVTLRTAGFNSVDFSALESPTLLFSMLWMFIGGSPGGAAGGIKTTTAAVLFLAVVATVRGHLTVEAFHRRIPHQTVYRAAAIATGGAAAVFLGFLALLLTQSMPGSMALFEVVSALGTVGLSTGGTARLDDLGKLIIAACMFAGRLGPLTLFVFLSRRSVKDHHYRPEEEIDVG